MNLPMLPTLITQIRLTLCLVIGVLTAASVHAQTPLEGWNDLRKQIESAYRSRDLPHLNQLAQQLNTWQAAEPEWKPYWQAYIAFRLSSIERGTDRAEQHLNTCVSAAETAVDSIDTSGEADALLSTCLGQLASDGLLAGMEFGLHSIQSKDDAVEKGPDNPRVLLLAGIIDSNAPDAFGGDVQRAEQRLRLALKLLRSPPDDNPPDYLPQWGLLDAYGHLALLMHQLERTPEALTLLKQAREKGLGSAWLDGIAERIQTSE